MIRRLGCLIPLLAALLPGLAGAAADGPDSGREAGRQQSLASAGRLWQSLPDAPEAARLQLRRNLVNATKLGIALTGAAVLWWGAALRRAGRPAAHRALRDRLLAGLGVASVFAWWNFGYFHYPRFVHSHEVFNYYIGAKYFPELGYLRLYECVAVADIESGLRPRVARRLITDLETYQLRDTRAILAEPRRCTRHFDAERWAAFKRDVGWFRGRFLVAQWEALQRDHGYNPSPAWGMLGGALAGSGAASEGLILGLALLDPLLDLLMWACVAWAFGWRPLCVALIYRGTNHPAEYGWAGGAFLRDDWLAATVISLCLLRRRRDLGAGFLLAYAGLLRVFPTLVWIPLGLSAGARMLAEGVRRPTAREVKLLAGAGLALALLVPLSLAAGGGREAWRNFAENMAIHVGVPANNAMGLQTVLSFDPTRRQTLLEASSELPDLDWKEGRLQALERRRPLFWGLALAFLALLSWAVRRQESWVAAVLGIGCIPVLAEPSCYYTAVLFAYGLLWARRESVGIALCLLSAALWVVAALWSAWDDIFVASSVAVLGFVVYATWTMGRSQPAAAASA